MDDPTRSVPPVPPVPPGRPTGKPVANRKVQIDGKSCPQRLSYWGVLDPPSGMRVTPSKSDVRNAFRSLIDR